MAPPYHFGPDIEGVQVDPTEQPSEVVPLPGAGKLDLDRSSVDQVR